MSNLNDWKLVNQRALGWYSSFRAENLTTFEDKTFTDDDKARIGFYFMGISLVTGQNSIDLLADSIIDTDYCSSVYGESSEDGGIDAVYIDDSTFRFYLFNFKYRDRKPGRQHEGDIKYPFLEALNNAAQSTQSFSGRVKDKFEELKKRLDSNDIWNGIFVQVSNDFQPLHGNNGVARTFDVNSFMSTFPFITEAPRSVIIDDFLQDENISTRSDAKVVFDVKDVISFKENSLDSENNFIAVFSLFNLLRITSTNNAIRNDPDYSNDDDLRKTDVDIKLLDANVRGWLGAKKKFHKKVFKTLDEDPSKFFIYNNGLTIVADRVKSKTFNGDKKIKIELINYQIVNGGQTIRNLFEWIRHQDNSEKMGKVYVLVRIFETGDNPELSNDIARYTNSQSAINAQDLKSTDSAQVKIREYLLEKGINYIRKRGDYSEKADLRFSQTITKEELAAALFTLKDRPELAISSAGKLFEDENYDSVFGVNEENEDNFDLDTLPELVKSYLSYKTAVRNLRYGTSRAHILYGLYLKEQQKRNGKKIMSESHNIAIVQSVISAMSKESTAIVNRPWIRDDFKIRLLKKAGLAYK